MSDDRSDREKAVDALTEALASVKLDGSFDAGAVAFAQVHALLAIEGQLNRIAGHTERLRQ